MLVLSRKSGERIVIGENVTVTILEIRPGAVKLGFHAPSEVSVHREEVHNRINGEPDASPPPSPPPVRSLPSQRRSRSPANSTPRGPCTQPPPCCSPR